MHEVFGGGQSLYTTAEASSERSLFSFIRIEILEDIDYRSF